MLDIAKPLSLGLEDQSDRRRRLVYHINRLLNAVNITVLGLYAPHIALAKFWEELIAEMVKVSSQEILIRRL